MPFRLARLHTHAVAVALSMCLAASALLSAATVTEELAQIKADGKAKQWERVRDRNLQLLSSRLDELTEDQAAACYKTLVYACKNLKPVDVAAMLKGLDALLLKPELQENRILADALNAAVWGAWIAEATEEAAQIIDKVLAYTDGQPVGSLGMYVVKISSLRKKDKQVEAAELAAKVVTSGNPRGVLNSWHVDQISSALVAGSKKDGNWARTATAWVHTLHLWDSAKAKIGENGESRPFALFRARILPNITDPVLADQVAQLAAARIPLVIHDPLKCHELQKAAVMAYVQTKQKDKAMAAIKTLYQTCPADRFDKTVTSIASMLKQMDGSISRANRFLDYVKFGTVGPDGKAGTEDDTANPFPEAKAELPQDVALSYQEAIQGDWKNTWEDRRCLAMLYRYMDEPAEALALLGEAFSLAPMEPLPLQLVAGDMTNVLIQLSGNPADGDTLAQFLKYGKEGRDGKLGSDDDLADPRAPFLVKAANN